MKLLKKDGSENHGVRMFAQHLAFNDCLYTNMDSYKYIFVFDTDEVIVPKMHDDLHQMMSFIRQSTQDRYATYEFESKRFCDPL